MDIGELRARAAHLRDQAKAEEMGAADLRKQAEAHEQVSNKMLGGAIELERLAAVMEKEAADKKPAEKAAK